MTNLESKPETRAARRAVQLRSGGAAPGPAASNNDAGERRLLTQSGR